MATQFIKCIKCQQEHFKPTSIPFKVTCYRCGTIIGSDNGEVLWFDLSNYNQSWNKRKANKVDTDRVYSRIAQYTFGIAGAAIFLAIIILGFRTIRETGISGKPNNSVALSKQPTVDTTSVDSSITTTSSANAQLSIYSGECTYYKKVLKDTTMHLESIETGHAKVVINRKLKKLYFYFNSKLVFHYVGYSSYTDNQQGGEGFTFDSDADAHRYSAERVFVLDTEMIMSGQLGYQYQITDYKED